MVILCVLLFVPVIVSLGNTQTGYRPHVTRLYDQLDTRQFRPVFNSDPVLLAVVRYDHSTAQDLNVMPPTDRIASATMETFSNLCALQHLKGVPVTRSAPLAGVAT